MRTCSLRERVSRRRRAGGVSRTTSSSMSLQAFSLSISSPSVAAYVSCCNVVCGLLSQEAQCEIATEGVATGMSMSEIDTTKTFAS